MNFEQAFDVLMEWEGGGKLHRDTRGILTKWGIASSAHPDVDVENLTKDEAMRIAKAQYWEPAKCSDLPEPYRYPVFDFAYNAGVSRSVKTLQNAMNDAVLARGFEGWKLLEVDGIPGRNTQTRARHLSGSMLVTRLFVHHRMTFYVHLGLSRPDMGASLNGWLRRAMEAI